MFVKSTKWFKGELSYAIAEDVLLGSWPNGTYINPTGAFLVRKDDFRVARFVLSVKFGDVVKHFNILVDRAGYYFLWIVKFDSVHQLIDYYRTSSVSRSQTVYLKDMAKICQQQLQDLLQLPNYQKGVVALYDFQPRECDELLVKKGDVITVTYYEDSNWWEGRNSRTNHKGFFPSAYVRTYNSTK
ncbi:growth factor receptor-bound protein 2-like [Mercenaria mercenaria]|uniref:growth factor receptor-bound protein 2-like n=1 Tax=Mercenaria mercenaria TaxID=6596 RepID=UPI00234F911C|nr:growth factor receptor-bound protein 2-like [Mercenaria mercenaria]